MITVEQLLKSIEDGTFCESDGMVETGQHAIYEFELVRTSDKGVVFVDHDYPLELLNYAEVKAFFDSRNDPSLDDQLIELGFDPATI